MNRFIFYHFFDGFIHYSMSDQTFCDVSWSFSAKSTWKLDKICHCVDAFINTTASSQISNYYTLYSNFDEEEKIVLSKALRILGETMEKEMASHESAIQNGFIDTKYGLSHTDFSVTLVNGYKLQTSIDYNEQSLSCTGSSWNSLGSSFAVSFGSSQSNGWSCRPGSVIVWTNLQEGGRDFSTIRLDHHVSILCCSFHPDSPALLACGLVNGQIVIWDTLDRPDDPISSSSVLTIGEIVQVRWIRNNSTETADDPWLLYCGSANGTVLVWSMKTNTSLAVYQISSGLCCFGVRGNDIIIGQTNGLVTQVKYTKMIQSFVPETWKQRINEKGCDEVSFRGHIGPVNDLSISPFNCTIFASCGNDSSIQIFRHSSHRTAIRRWESISGHSLTCVKFSPHRPCLLAVSSADGFLSFFDLRLDAFVPILVLHISDHLISSGVQSSPTVHRLGVGINSFSFNPQVPDSIAVLDSEGGLSMWKLNFDDDKGIYSEINQLNNLM